MADGTTDGTQDQVSDEEALVADAPEGGADTEGSAADAPAENVQVSAGDDAASAVDPVSTASAAGDPRADTGRVARIVAALRKAHAEQPAPAAQSSAAAEPADPPAPRRETSGVRFSTPGMPTLHWNPGARYRASQLANQAARPAAQQPAHEAAVAAPPVQIPLVPGPDAPGPQAALPTVPMPLVPMPPVPLPPVPLPPAASSADSLPPVPEPPAPLPPVPAPPVGAPPALAGRLFRGPARRTAVFEREIWYPTAPSSRIPSDVGEALAAAVERYRKGSISTSGLVRAIASTHAA